MFTDENPAGQGLILISANWQVTISLKLLKVDVCLIHEKSNPTSWYIIDTERSSCHGNPMKLKFSKLLVSINLPWKQSHCRPFRLYQYILFSPCMLSYRWFISRIFDRWTHIIYNVLQYNISEHHFAEDVCEWFTCDYIVFVLSFLILLRCSTIYYS